MNKDCKDLKTVFENTPVLLAYLDRDFNFIRVNKAYAEADNKDPSYFSSKNHFDLYPNEENEKIFQSVVESGEAVFIRGKPFEYPENPERGITYWDWSLIPIKDSEGEVESLVFTLMDVTEREKARQKLRESKKKSIFYKDLIAHDMRNILFVVQSSVELMENWEEKRLGSDEVKEMMGRIKKQSERGAELISNVQKLSKAEKEERDIRPVLIKKMLERTITDIQKSFDEQEISIETEFPNESITVEGGELLIDAFENILINGVVHNSSETKKLWIKISQIERYNKPYIKLEFKDNGIGIQREDKEKVFQRGVKTEHSYGMGIGLSLVKEIIEGYNGRIWVENRIKDDYTKGSNFILLLKEH